MESTRRLLERGQESLRKGRISEAFGDFTRVTEVDPSCADAWHGRGAALMRQDAFAQAGAQFQQALRIDAQHVASRLELAQVLFQFGLSEQALEHLDRIAGQTAGQAEQLAAIYAPGATSVSPLGILERRRAFAATLPPIDAGRVAWPPRAGGPLRIGYLSAHFDLANYMKPVWGVVNEHDREALALCFFSDASGSADAAGYRPHPADRWFDVRPLDNRSLAERIRGEQLDVLVDLNAYSYARRLPLWSARIAPVNAAWFNMYATSGLPGFQFLIGDRHVVQPGESGLFSETILALAHSYLTFRVPYATPEVADRGRRAADGLTLGCLAPMYKINDAVLAVWSSLMRRVPSARLLLRNAALGNPPNRQFVESRLQAAGLPLDRIELRGPAPHFDFLRTYDDVDLALDTFPYNGGSTTMEALWQGVPVAAFRGDRWAARISASLLAEAGLEEFIADGPESHLEQLIEQLRAPGAAAQRAELRRGLRDRLLASPVCDTVGMARELETVYRRVAEERSARSPA